MTDDIAALVAAGTRVRTRDRRDIADLAVEADGTITGKVPMVGSCRWRPDGHYENAPGGGAGPLDLVAGPMEAGAASQRGSVVGQLDNQEAKNSCCD